MPSQAFAPMPPFSGLAALSAAGSGVVATDLDGQGLATVAVKKYQIEALAKLVRERFSLELPRGNYRSAANGIAFAGIGPESWLATQERNAEGFAASLAGLIGAVASVADQSDGYAVLRLSGPKLREVLAKLVPIDVHPLSFKSGDVASTVAFHMGVTLWRMPDDSGGGPVFQIAVFRSLAASLWHALADSAAEFGLIVAPRPV